MTVLSSVQLAILAGGVSLGYVAFGGYLFRRYDEIGLDSLATFSILWGSSFVAQSMLIYAFGTYGITDGAQLIHLESVVPTGVQAMFVSMDLLSELLVVSGIFMWLWFVLRYTQRIGRREKLTLTTIGGATFTVVMINGLVGATDTFGLISIHSTVRSSLHQFGAVIEVLGTGAAIGVGVGLLYTTATNHRPFRMAAVVGLSVPVVFPWLIGYLYQFGLLTDFQLLSGFRIVGLSVGLAGLWVTTTKYDLFDQLPASRTVGRQTAFDASDTAIVVVNRKNSISDLNPAASELFSVSTLETIGAPFDTILPDRIAPSDLRESEPVVFRMPNSETIIEAVMTTATDNSDTPIGRTVVFTDITAERRRQQRIQVLNRILRHNLRNDLNAAKGYVGVMADGGTESDIYQQKVESILDDLVTIGKKAQRAENVLEADPLAETPIQLGEIITDALEAVRADYGAIPVSGSVPAAVVVRINPTVLGSIIQELVENAARHTDSEITISYDEATTTLSVVDEGSGIPGHEITVLDNAQETDLEHGSGLGLWLVKWGTDSIGGSVTFDTDETGTRVRLTLPADLVEELE